MKKAKIQYFTLTDEMLKGEKLDFFRETRLQDIPFETIHPDKDNNWVDLTDNDFETLLPLANKQTKLSKNKSEEQAVFKLFSLGVVTNRDEWVYDFDNKNNKKKLLFFIEKYNKQVKSKKYSNDELDYSIKWTRAVKNDLSKGDYEYCTFKNCNFSNF